MFKRLFDITFAIFGLIITLPAWFVFPLAIKIDSPGPVLYRQKRTTLYNKVFYIYKFRTMVKNAERMGARISDNKRDRRITKVGRLLRRFYIDEIPQLINILLGQMSVVGPRPERPVFNRKFSENIKEWNKRVYIKPGLTGYAQIHNITGLNPKEKIKHDLFYIKNQSLYLDTKIVVRQILKLFW